MFGGLHGGFVVGFLSLEAQPVSSAPHGNLAQCAQVVSREEVIECSSGLLLAIHLAGLESGYQILGFYIHQLDLSCGVKNKIWDAFTHLNVGNLGDEVIQ